ncbi:unnamed protein product [Periconia digitata]|uniref:non-specific serine/threonine protein kinase n=1 Tax=Periconia digitata TaxID=1303443 RepID=A0A9W4XYV2_9PLEO|nr:unnamed protein product [Periconia digitata]
MARKGGNATQRQTNHPIHPGNNPSNNGGVPPPSTIPAQIIQSAANKDSRRAHNNGNGANIHSHHANSADKASFVDQVKEFLRKPELEDADDVCIAFAFTITNGGLDPLFAAAATVSLSTTDDPFSASSSSSAHLNEQGHVCLAALSSIFLQRSRLLLAPIQTDGGTTDAAPRPPLVVWLLPKLLGLLGLKSLAPIHEDVRSLLGTCVIALWRSADALHHVRGLLQMYRSCVESILSTATLNLSSYEPSFKVDLPCSSSIMQLWPDCQNLVALPEGLQRTITSPFQAIYIGFQLLQVLFPIGTDVLISHERLQPWGLDSTVSLWRCFQDWIAISATVSLRLELEATYLQLLETIALPRIDAEDSFSCSAKSAMVLMPALVSLLQYCCEPHCQEATQIRFAALFNHLRGVSNTIADDRPPGDKLFRLGHLIRDGLEPSIADFCRDTSMFVSLHRDLKLSLCLWTPAGDWPAEVEELRSHLCSDNEHVFLSEELNEDYLSLNAVKVFRDKNEKQSEPPAKRRKTLAEAGEGKQADAYQELVVLLNTSKSESPVLNLSGLDQTIRRKYSQMSSDKEESDQEQREILLAFSKIACAATQSLRSSGVRSGTWRDWNCSVCDEDGAQQDGTLKYWDAHSGNEAWVDAVAGMLAVIEQERFEQSAKSRILMAVAIGRVFNHLSCAEYLSLNSSLGEWLLKTLTRSLREARIAASRSLMSFLRNSVPKPVRDRNRKNTLAFFGELSERNSPGIQETLVMAYGQAARVCGQVERQIILGQLVNYLGHPNTVICGVAYNELSSLAYDLGISCKDMFQPYWRTIGFSVVDELLKKPQKAQYICDLIGTSIEQFLGDVHGDILAVLVLNKRKDILDRIAKARRTTVGDICMQPRVHLARILALLLCQKGGNVERQAMACLTAVESRFGEKELHDLVHQEPALVACEVLKLAAECGNDDKKLYYDGFSRVATLNDIGETSRDMKKSKSTGDALAQCEPNFISTHILGVMTEFSNVIENSTGNQPLSEQRRCVGAIKELIHLAAEDSCFALPQIRACLQSAMDTPDLCDQAFDVWTTLLVTLETEHMKTIIDQTFALIIHNWPSFSEESQMKAAKALETLRSQHNVTLQERIAYIPSLASIPVFSKLEGEMTRIRATVEPVVLFGIFGARCNDENTIVVRQALKELIPFLEEHQDKLHLSAIGQKPLPALATLSRSLLDACVRFAGKDMDIPRLCAQCLGIIGGLDPYRIETIREKKRILVLSNFQSADEGINFAAFMLENVIVNVFLTTTNPQSQGFLAYLMQELCKACGFKREMTTQTQRARYSQPSTAMQRWEKMPEPVRNVVTPFLSSRYSFRHKTDDAQVQYPIFTREISHGTWLRQFTYDLLLKAKEPNAQIIFNCVASVLRRQDLSIASFILPFAALSAVLDGKEEADIIVKELLNVLNTDLQTADQVEAANIKQCSENVFEIIDYFALWLHEKQKKRTETRVTAHKTGRGMTEKDETDFVVQVSKLEGVLHQIPAKIISKRAMECGSYTRALFHWEKYYREEQTKSEAVGEHFAKNDMLQHLQYIYAQIDEPDGVEGLSAHLQILNSEQQIMEDRKAGRWTAAQSWYELALAEKPKDPETQVNLLTCLKESGQYDAILNYVDGFHASDSISPNTLPFAAEAAWSSGRWDQLEKILNFPSHRSANASSDFNVGIGKALLSLKHRNEDQFKQNIDDLRGALTKSLTPTATDSLHASHDQLVKLHTLYELDAISGMSSYAKPVREAILDNLDRRLDIIGAYTSDKQYLLGVRRAAMTLSDIGFTKLDIASAWLTTASLLRKGDFTPAAFNAILHASQLGDDASKIEYSKMLWKEGHHRKAIQHIRGAIISNSFQTRDLKAMDPTVSVTTAVADGAQTPNRVKAHAQLLLAKWLDQAGQTNHNVLKEEYGKGIMMFPKWDKGHYYLGRYYLKIYETEKAMPPPKQTQVFVAGELTKLVVENFARSTVYGAKYYHQTIPKMITLWLDMGTEVINTQPKLPRDKELFQHKVNHLDVINKYIKRYANERMPAYPWYTALPQIISRISHPDKNVYDVLQNIILKVMAQYPQQGLWSLFALLHSTQDGRRQRGTIILQKLRDSGKRKGSHIDLRSLILHGQKLTDALLFACDTQVEPRASHVSLSRDLGFRMSLAPCALVVPIEAAMTPTLPSGNDSRTIRAHNPFPQETITISEFQDDVFVLSSLQRPRKLVVRGSDGRSYGLMCKPKDDLRKDQRLMEFNAMINRAFQRDTESTKRRLYIKTYAVTPLNEECGAIEWVEGLKPMRDIIIRLYRQKNINIDYNEIRVLLNEASSSPSKTPIFTHKILRKFPSVMSEWFLETFPEPEAWFAARLRYMRSCAVMSIVGHVLGLGDRHGENVLLEEGNGGTFHVDFNCLFDKGLTFEKPELVPFRLTHNMVDAMGPSGVEGPFRATSEITYSILRQHLDTLITILETFVHDPTTDFVGQRKKKRIPGVPETPREVLEMVRGKVEGEVRGESLKLSVEGYVEWLIAQARDPWRLAGMYIGWCAFF